MPASVDKDGVRALARRGARIVEVLPRAEYDEAHLPGAISIPLKELDARSTASLGRGVPVVVYCHDHL